MTFLYHDSDRVDRGWRDFVPLELPPYAQAIPTQSRLQAPGNIQPPITANATYQPQSIKISENYQGGHILNLKKDGIYPSEHIKNRQHNFQVSGLS